MNYALSIIIPIYGVEKYIQTCLDSIIPQITHRNDVELILVNDGTKDRSALIAASAIQGLQCAKLITQENQGLSVARNNGLDLAKGDYVWFIDSDDTIAVDSIDGIIKKLLEKPDMLQLNYQNTFEDGRNPKENIFCGDYENCHSGKYIIACGSLPAPAQFTIYSRKFLIEYRLYFKPSIYHEDSEFKPRATYLAKAIAFHKPIVYNYLQRSSGSITSSFRLKNGIDIISVAESLHFFYENNVSEKECIKGFCRCIGLNINTLLYGLRSLSKNDRYRLIEILYGKKHLFKDMIRSGVNKYIIEGLLLSFNIKVALFLHRIIR